MLNGIAVGNADESLAGLAKGVAGDHRHVLFFQQALAELYRRARVSMIVSKRETFSMPCAESLCCGTPVIGFEAGAPEQIALREYSEFVSYGDLQEMETVLRKWLT